MNKVNIRSNRACFTNIIKCKYYNFPKLDYVDKINKDIIGKFGTIIYAFRHTYGYIIFIVKMNEGKYKNKHIMIGRTGIKKAGKINKKIQNIDTKTGIIERQKYKLKNKL